MTISEMLPRFYQVKMGIMYDITSTGMQRGDTIPSAKQIAGQYHVSYLTARRAVEELVNDGILKREPGHMAEVARIPELSDRPGQVPGEKKTSNIYLFTGSSIIKSPGGLIAGIYRAVETVLQQHDMQAFLRLIRRNTVIEEVVAQEIKAETVDGVIVVCYYHEEVAVALHKHGIPAVFIDYAPESVPVDSVNTNNYKSVLQGMDHLHKLGHRRIDFVGHYHNYPRKDFDALEHEFLWRRFLERKECTGRAHYFGFGKDDIDGLLKTVLEIPDPPTAVFLSNPGNASSFLDGLKKKKTRVPEDLSLVTQGGGLNKGVRVTSTEIDWFEIARLAVQRLQDLIDGRGKPGSRITHAGRFVDRGTTGPVKRE